MSSVEACECRYCGDSFTAAGIKNHETYCDENPNPGLSPAQQRELGVGQGHESGSDADPDHGTDPHQEVGSGAGGGALPPRETLRSDDKPTPSARRAATDGSDDLETACPLCETERTMPSADARREYEADESNPLPAVVLAFALSRRYCRECFALWGDEFPEPVPLDEAVGAVEGEA